MWSTGRASRNPGAAARGRLRAFLLSDNRQGGIYAEEVDRGAAHIILKICTKQPIEVGDFVGQFTSLSSQYEKFVREHYPELSEEANIFVAEIRPGSIIVDLIPWAANVTPLLDHAQKALIDHFVKKYADRIGAYFGLGKPPDATKSDIQDFLGAVEAIANDPNGSASIEAAVFEDGKREIRAAFKFNTRQARRAKDKLETQKREIEQLRGERHKRVLMTFIRSDKTDTQLGKRSGELVIVESLATKALPLIYGSELAEQRIKHEIREADDNVYKKGFVVDVTLETRQGKPVAYRVDNFHSVIDLPDD